MDDNWHPDSLYSEHKDRTCKYCDEQWLHWMQDDNGNWRLYNDNDEQHFCEEDK